LGHCYVCNCEIDIEFFEVGHVVPACVGGGENVLNLEPVCRSCNSDMGSMHLEDYKKLCEQQLKR
jgi:5-methylcytosine-specific restriction endonuclease McrA